MLMNIFIFQIFVVVDILLFGLGVYIGFAKSGISEIADKIHAVMIGIYSAAFFSFIMFQVNPLFIIGTGFDLFISYVSGWLMGFAINRLISS